jgi:hypothetical protein
MVTLSPADKDAFDLLVLRTRGFKERVGPVTATYKPRVRVLADLRNISLTRQDTDERAVASWLFYCICQNLAV